MGKSIKNNGKKIAGGLLVMALLLGGFLTSRSLIQQRTQVEQQAAPPVACKERDRGACSGCFDDQTACKWIGGREGECKKVGDTSCGGTPPIENQANGCLATPHSNGDLDGKYCTNSTNESCSDTGGINSTGNCNKGFCCWKSPESSGSTSGDGSTIKGCQLNNACDNCQGWGKINGACCPIGAPDKCETLGTYTCIKDPYVSQCVVAATNGFPECPGNYYQIVQTYETTAELLNDPRCKTTTNGGGPQSHLVCQNNACVSISGEGVNSCSNNSDCQEDTHLVCQDNACVSVSGAGTNECSENTDCAEESLACTDLTKDKATPTLGDSLTYSCEANFSTTSPVARFRWNVNGAAWQLFQDAGYPINTTTNKASADLLIDQVGTWTVQCQVCSDSTLTSCTEWGLAN
jgi:hypothetical protein